MIDCTIDNSIVSVQSPKYLGEVINCKQPSDRCRNITVRMAEVVEAASTKEAIMEVAREHGYERLK